MDEENIPKPQNIHKNEVPRERDIRTLVCYLKDTNTLKPVKMATQN